MTSDITFSHDPEVKLVDCMGDDDSIVKAMLVSTQGEESLLANATQGRIEFLMKNRHGTPFEHNAMTFYVAAPIKVFREFHRHRIGFSYNEMSGRYKELPPRFYIPGPDRPLVQQGKPGAYDYVVGTQAQYALACSRLKGIYTAAYAAYKDLLEAGVAKEVARDVLPAAIFSEMYVTCNARSLMAFLSLRTRDGRATIPSKPMYEIEQVANRMEIALGMLFPKTYEAFNKFGRVAP